MSAVNSLNESTQVHAYPPWLKAAIRAGQAFHLRDGERGLSNALNIAWLAALVCMIYGCLAAASRIASAPVTLLASAGVGLGYFALFILVVHEASHGLFIALAGKRRTIVCNRAFGWMVCVPFAVHYFRHWERGHLTHHLYPLESCDPQQYNALSGVALGRRLLYLMVPGSIVMQRHGARARRKEHASSSGALLAAAGLFWLASGWWVYLEMGGHALFAWLYGVQITGMLNQIKGALEHGGEVGREPNPYMRSRSNEFPLRHLLMPFNITLHFEHHLNFQVPWHRLQRYRRALREILPSAVQHDLMTSTPLLQLAGRGGGLSTAAREAFDHSSAIAATPTGPLGARGMRQS